MCHNLDTTGGQSGFPLLDEDFSGHDVIAIHLGGAGPNIGPRCVNSDSGSNVGLNLWQKHVDKLNAWAKTTLPTP
jgi:V8-like Glu-specific endopeptidase